MYITDHPSSIADHMYRMAMCSFLVTDPGVDRARCVFGWGLGR